MLHDVITGSVGELLGGLALVLVLALTAWTRRRRMATRPDTPPDGGPAAARHARRYTLLGTRAADGHPEQVVSSRPAGTVVSQRGPGRRQRFELTDAILADGTYAAEPLDRYR
ncbi:hypothetical protein ACH4U5_31410 [Streptomyces sp. NPDC020858]|uniref:hypothetical protein n=1 Tax=Streptomyces sp. NPDC020858 TaxID=3365097 RepID=UPI00379EAC23